MLSFPEVDMPTAARAAVMTAPGQDLEILEYPLTRPEPGAILVRVNCCTICGSDLHSWTGRRASPLPIILGHEIVGTVVEMGDGVTHDLGDRPLRPGDRVTWTLMASCGQCRFCRDLGMPMKCRRLRKYGHDACDVPPHLTGGFAEYCYLGPGTAVIKLPDGVSDRAAAPANCSLATAAAGWEAAGLQPFETVLILGAGALGCHAAALAAHTGCRRVIVADRLMERLAFVRRFGATDTLNLSGMDQEAGIRTVREMTDDLGVDCALEVAGAPELIPLGLRCLRIGGRLTEIGSSFPDARFTYDAGDIVWRRLTLTGVHNYDARHLRAGIDLLAAATPAARFPFDEIVTHQVGLDDVNKGLRLARSPEAIRVAVVP